MKEMINTFVDGITIDNRYDDDRIAAYDLLWEEVCVRVARCDISPEAAQHAKKILSNTFLGLVTPEDIVRLTRYLS